MYSENVLATIVIGEAIYIHKTLGSGLLESVYQACLSKRLRDKGLLVEEQVLVPIFFEGAKLGPVFKIDILIEQKLVLELKSVEYVIDAHKAQLLTYLRLTDKKLGLILNYKTPLMKQGVHRIVNRLAE